MKFTEADYDAITEAVEAAEAKTTAELVVVIRPQSGSYRDVCYAAGAVASFLALLFVLYSPYDFSPFWIPPELAVIFAIVALLVGFSSLRRALTTKARRKSQVLACASAAFFAEGVGRTRAHTGVLIYFSMLERRIELLPDTGVLQAVPLAEWREFLKTLKPAAHAHRPTALFIERLHALGELLGRFMPANDADNPDEIPNRPRVGKKREGKKRSAQASEQIA